jgi:hypothetical protein
MATFAAPADFGCPQGAYHEWTYLGSEGPTGYACKKCSVNVKTAALPEAKNCPAGGAHSWAKAK